MPKELLRLSPGFYMALSNVEFPVEPSGDLVRFYWDLRSEGATALVSELTARLNAEQLAFRLKVLSDPMAYLRADAGVLYTLGAQYPKTAKVVMKVYQKLSGFLRPPTPALTRQLEPGLGFAQDQESRL